MAKVQKNFNLAWLNPSKIKEKKDGNLVPASRADLIRKIADTSSILRGKIAVFKLDALVIENPDLLENFADNISTLVACGVKVFIVHDYTNFLAITCQKYGMIEENIVRQINDEKSYEMVEMALSGHINKRLVTVLCQKGLTAIGISGKDGNLIIAKKIRKSLVINELPIPNYYVSEPLLVSPEILFALEDSSIPTVISPISFNENKKTCILDIDSTVAILASSISADHLFLLCDLKLSGRHFVTIKGEEELAYLQANNKLKLSLSKSLIKAAYHTITNCPGSVHFVDSKIKDGIINALFYPQ